MRKSVSFLIGLVVLCLLTSCKKTYDGFNSDPLSSYYPLIPGNYITYNLDSTLYVNFGQKDTVIKYQVKDLVDVQIKDNSGRDAYRILRYIRKDSTQAWTPNNTFMAVPTATNVEYVENNFRYIKLQLPIKEGYSWKGNSFIDTYSLYSDVKYMDNWDYVYQDVGLPATIGNMHLDSTLTVLQRDEFIGSDPSQASTQYAEKNYSIEKYAKGIGLAYKEFLHWEYQGARSGSPSYYVGYGVKLTITGHN